MNHKRTLHAIGLSALLLLFFISFPLRYGLADTSEGGVNISTTPQPTQIFIYDSGSWDEADSLTPADEMYVNFTIDDADLGTNLDWVRVAVFDEAKNTYDGTLNQTTLARFYWNQTVGSWNITEETGSTWQVNTGASSNSSLSENFVNFTLVFTPGKTAFEETTNQWRVNVSVLDLEGLEGFNATIESDTWPSSTGGPCDFYQELSITQGETFYNFTAASPEATVQIYNTNEGANTYLIFSIIANGIWDINCSVTDWTRQGGGGTMDVDATEIQRIDDGSEFTFGNQEIDPIWVNTTSHLFWDGSVLGFDNTFEAGQTKNLYMELTIPAAQVGGFYSQTLTVIGVNG